MNYNIKISYKKLSQKEILNKTYIRNTIYQKILFDSLVQIWCRRVPLQVYTGIKKLNINLITRVN